MKMKEQIDELFKRVDSLEKEIYRDCNDNQWIFLPLKKAASYLGIAVGTLRNMTYSKEIPYYKPRGKLIYFLIPELNQWIESGKIDNS